SASRCAAFSATGFLVWLITLSTKESLASSRPQGRGLYPNFFGSIILYQPAHSHPWEKLFIC
ncbi:MAG: hypothetical protein WBB43_13280, partial [Limnoraphis sp.]